MSKAKFKVGARVQTKAKKDPKIGTIIAAKGKGIWVVKWEDGGEDSNLLSQQLNRYTAPLPELEESGSSDSDGENGDENCENDDENEVEDNLVYNSLDRASEFRAKKRRFDKVMSELTGSTLEVEEKSTKKKIVWTFQDPKIITEDQFPEVAGTAKDTEEEKEARQVLRNVQFADRPGDKLKVFLNLFPGGVDEYVKRLNDEHGRLRLTSGEFVVFLGLMIGARCRVERGRALWNKDSTSKLRGAPDYARFMTRNRFEKLKEVVADGCAYPFEMSKPWCKFQRMVDDFNKNRHENIIPSRVLTVDESMSAFRPRTTALGGLPNLSYIRRKPEPLGTEFKNVADGETGVLLFLEIQEGKGPMKKKRFRDTMKSNGSCALRVGLGALGDLGT